MTHKVEERIYLLVKKIQKELKYPDKFCINFKIGCMDDDLITIENLDKKITWIIDKPCFPYLPKLK
jgi:hypothetical protein